MAGSRCTKSIDYLPVEWYTHRLQKQPRVLVRISSGVDSDMAARYHLLRISWIH